jgi:hypothetical protein
VIGGWISKRQGLASVFPGMAVLIVPALVAIILLWLIFKPGPQEDVPTPESL